MSTGFGGAESGKIRISDIVAVFAQGPIGLCATAGARLMGTAMIFAVDRMPERLEMARRMGAPGVVDRSKVDPLDEIGRFTDGRDVDDAIKAPGLQATFEAALRVLQAGGTLSSPGAWSGDLKIPEDVFVAGLGDRSNPPRLIGRHRGGR
jgi:threonine dehydrogenase-like Zn-dependent dehydrogenase